ncbi:similar to Saccharomyces cerevisiae YML009C MRPL39 Mitochondrial ribosomal protein of the large subunit [Geotrichum candidum]|uniref:Large ribosomal subunit protein bL33m n=1 Tax=Geotrichum candidum TaxID=1173061 RepID=A0A0J9X8M9_GEOCN|nr:similar to Saccharomyces cerevisiae YML009C MRPL39 Mitochondrial ribosomal protein of the large subunit [Geotrichum candidum]
MVSKAKGRYTLIKLISTAKTGFIRYVQRPRSSSKVTQVRYDPIAKRHVLFQENKKRKITETKPPVYA